MFRFAFHTGFLSPEGIMRLKKADLVSSSSSPLGDCSWLARLLTLYPVPVSVPCARAQDEGYKDKKVPEDFFIDLMFQALPSDQPKYSGTLSGGKEGSSGTASSSGGSSGGGESKADGAGTTWSCAAHGLTRFDGSSRRSQVDCAGAHAVGVHSGRQEKVRFAQPLASSHRSDPAQVRSQA